MLNTWNFFLTKRYLLRQFRHRIGQYYLVAFNLYILHKTAEKPMDSRMIPVGRPRVSADFSIVLRLCDEEKTGWLRMAETYAKYPVNISAKTRSSVDTWKPRNRKPGK
jgi:hypothetical protein